MATCQGAEMAGAVKGANVILSVKTGARNELTAVLPGTLNQAGTTIDGMWRLNEPTGERTGRFTLTSVEPQ